MAGGDGEFWREAEDWSRRKHLILDYYLHPAAAKLRQVSPDGRVIVIDGFAGRGEYEDGTPGSPVLMGQLTERTRSWGHPVDLKVVNIEPDDENYQELQQCTAPWTKLGSITNLHGTFQTQLPVALRAAADSPLFAFLDPFRPKHLLFEDFVPLLRRRATTELCFVFHTPAVLRMLEAVRPEGRTNPRNREGLQIRLNEVFGGDHWERLLAPDTIDPEAIVGCFRAALLARGARGTTHVITHPGQVRYQVGLKYHIVFFTRNPHGFTLMNDAFCEEARSVFGRSVRSSQMSLFTDSATPPIEMEPAERMRLLHDTLIAIARQAPARRWKRNDLVFECLRRHCGHFKRAEHLQALKELFKRDAGPRFQPVDGRCKQNGEWETNDGTTLTFLE